MDHDDSRRDTRFRMLLAAGYEVAIRENDIEAEAFNHEPSFNLIVIALHNKRLEEAAAYSETLRKNNPRLPILLLTDQGVYVPRGALSPTLETGVPEEFMREVANLLSGSTHIDEVSTSE